MRQPHSKGVSFSRRRSAALLTVGWLVASSIASSSVWSKAQGEAATVNDLGAIIVTARRQKEDAQSVPLSTSVLSGEAIDQRQVQDLESLSVAVPSMTIYALNRTNETISIRGQSGAGASAQGQEPAVTQYFAEVPLPVADGGGPGRYFDLENIQILKGPQGTLFGRNSTGGAVLYEPKRPTGELGGTVLAQLGSYYNRQLQAVINIPIVSGKLFIRAAGERTIRRGFTENISNGQALDGQNYWSSRLGVLWMASDRFENYAVADVYRSNSSGSSEILAGLNPAFFGPVALAFNAQAQSLGIRATASDVDAVDRTRSGGITDIATWKSDDITIRNIAGYRAFKQRLRVDNDGSPLPIIDLVTSSGASTREKQYTDEMQVSGKSLNGKFHWTIGGFFLYAHPGGHVHVDVEAFFVPVEQTVDPTEHSRAVYGHAIYDLTDVAPGLRLSAGYRYTWDSRSLRTGETVGGTCALFDLNGRTVCEVTMAARFRAPSWDVSLDYSFLPGAMAYVAARRGYRSGGLNTQVFNAAQIPFAPEHVKDVEIGVKTDWKLGGSHGRLNVAGYRTDFTSIQASEGFNSIVNGVMRSTNLIGNFGTATINGVELEGTVQPRRDLELSIAWAYTNAKYDSFLLIATGKQQFDRPFPYTPRNKMSVRGRYDFLSEGGMGTLSLQPSWSYSSSVRFSVFAGEKFEPQKPYHQLDMRINWSRIFGSDLDLAIIASNLTNAKYRIGGIPIYNESGVSTYVWDRPRMVGVQLNYGFGDGI